MNISQVMIKLSSNDIMSIIKDVMDSNDKIEKYVQNPEIIIEDNVIKVQGHYNIKLLSGNFGISFDNFTASNNIISATYDIYKSGVAKPFTGLLKNFVNKHNDVVNINGSVIEFNLKQVIEKLTAINGDISGIEIADNFLVIYVFNTNIKIASLLNNNNNS